VAKKVLVAIPVAHYHDWLANFELFPSCDYLVFDNSDDERVGLVCQRRGISIVKSLERLGRLDSWIECYKIASLKNYQWVKPLFVGDILKADFLEDLKNRNSDVVIFRYRIRFRNYQRNSRRVRNYFNPILNTAVHGPWSGPPLSIAFKGDKFLESLSHSLEIFGPWTSDFSAVYNLLNLGTFEFSNCIVGEFNTSQRETWRKLKNDSKSMQEEIEWMKLARGSLSNPKSRIYRTYARVLVLCLRRGLIKSAVHQVFSIHSIVGSGQNKNFLRQ
jgi:hypothetical protein